MEYHESEMKSDIKSPVIHDCFKNIFQAPN